MTMNPGLAEQLAASRLKDLERAAHGHRLAPTAAVEPFAPSSLRPDRGALARHVGVLLISVGRRLAGSEALPAFDGPHRH
jgi:hypothetical protein